MEHTSPLCAWSPPGARGIFFIYEGGGIPANTWEATLTYWTE